MKKTMIFFVVIILTFFSTSYFLFSLPKTTEKIIVERGNGGLFGYKNVNEWHFYDENCKCNVHKLSCWDPGYSSCTWMHRPSSMRLVDYAEEQIKKNNLNGYYEENFGGFRHTVEWNATDEFNANITETIYELNNN